MATVKDFDSGSLDSGGFDEWGAEEAPSRVIVNREHPPSRLSVIIRAEDDTVLGRWAEDERSVENVIGNLTKTGDMPGGHGEAGCVLARDPKRSYPDLALFSKFEIQGAGREKLWQGTLRQEPQSDGDHIAIEPKAVGDKQFLEDDEGVIGPPFIHSGLSEWTGPSTQRRVGLAAVNAPNQADPQLTQDAAQPSLRLELQNGWPSPSLPRSEAWFDAGIEMRITQVLGEWKNGWPDTNFILEPATTDSPIGEGAEGGGDLYAATTGFISVTPATPRRYFLINWRYNATPAGGEGSQYPIDLVNLVVLGTSLPLQGTWPEVGYTAKQMIPLIVEGSGLTTVDELLEDDGLIIPQAWFSEPATRMSKLVEVTKYGLLDRFVFNDRILQYRFPGTYGRTWRLDSGSAPKSSGPDANRVWREFRVQWQDVDGSTRTAEVAPVTDPRNAAVAAGRPRRKLLKLNGVCTESLALETAERFREEAEQLDQSGEATLTGYVQDRASHAWFPAAYVQPGDRVYEPATGLERKITSCPYNHDQKAASVSLGSHPEGMDAIEARFNAKLIELGLGT